MDKPEKPRIKNLSSLFGRLFQANKIRNSGQFKKNPGWHAKPVMAISDRPNPNLDPAIRFKNLTSESVATTPPQTFPNTRTLPKAIYPENPIYFPDATHPDQPAKPAHPLAKSISTQKPFFQPAKTLPAFWTVASLLSLIINVILIVVLILLGRELFVLKALVGDQLLGGLYENFIYMDTAHIKTNINVADTIPINFSLPISQDTVVVLTQNTSISGANVRINTGGITINSTASIVLPAGTKLPVHLDLNVPVTTTVPININVPVDIPLQQTELHRPFIGLQQVVAPFYNLLQPQVKKSQDLQICKPFSDFCAFYFQK
jgi:hypothetical protein